MLLVARGGTTNSQQPAKTHSMEMRSMLMKLDVLQILQVVLVWELLAEVRPSGWAGSLDVWEVFPAKVVIKYPDKIPDTISNQKILSVQPNNPMNSG